MRQSGSARRLLVGQRLRSSTSPTPAELAELPLHAKHVGLVDFQSILSLARPSRAARLQALWHDVFYAPSPDYYAGKRFCTLLPQHIDVLLTADIIEPFASTCEFTPTCSVFTVKEDRPSGQRQRVICWTQDVNLIAYESAFDDLIDPIAAIARVLEPCFATELDLKAAFYQVEVPQDARHRFVFTALFLPSNVFRWGHDNLPSWFTTCSGWSLTRPKRGPSRTFRVAQ